MDDYLENRQIYEELEYYKNSHGILGKHPIFRQYSRAKEINAMSIKELMKEQRKAQYNAWRVRKLIARGDKPYLETERKAKLEQYESDLKMINKLLE